MAVQIAKHLFDVSEYHRLAQAGIFSEDDRVELINGDVVEMSPIGSRHAACVRRLDAVLHETAAPRVVISVQNPILLDDYSEPEPDVAVLKPRIDYYSGAHPRPEDVLVAIEVSDTSTEYDRLVKLPLYGRAGIPEVWLVDLTRDVIESHAGPLSDAYQTFREFKRGETITSHSIPALTLPVDDILG